MARWTPGPAIAAAWTRAATGGQRLRLGAALAAVPTNEANAALTPETLGNPGDENWAGGIH